MLFPEGLQHRQQEGMQGHLAGADGHHASLQAPLQGKLPFSGLKLLERRRNVGEQPLPLRGQGHAPLGPGEQGTAQFSFQIGDDAGHIGLIGHQCRRRTGEAAVNGGKIKDPVIVIADVHGDLRHIKLVWIIL